MINSKKKLPGVNKAEKAILSISSIGFGSMASAFCRILKSNGQDVIIGARKKNSESAVNAKNSNFKITSIKTCIKNSEYILLAIPDANIPDFFKYLEGSLFANKCIILCHGYSFLYRPETFPINCDIILISPNAIANKFLENNLNGVKNYALTSILKDVTGKAQAKLFDICDKLNLNRTDLVNLTVKQEVISDLFAEQTLLVGGILALMLGSFETLKKNGIPARAAYLSTFHEIKYIVDTICENGVSKFINNISRTALYGSVSALWESGFVKIIENKFNQIYENIDSQNFYNELNEINQNTEKKSKIERHIKSILKSDICKIYEQNAKK